MDHPPAEDKDANPEDATLRIIGPVTHSALKPTKMGQMIVSSFTHIGKRGNQEDRLIICPQIAEGEFAFFGIFDGTVKEHASEFVHKTIHQCLVTAPSFRKFQALPKESRLAPANRALLRDAVHQMYMDTDDRLLAWCREHRIHYSSTTSVTALIHIPTKRLFVAHLGDSKIIMSKMAVEEEGEEGGAKDKAKDKAKPGAEVARESTPRVGGVELTYDHKPDQPEELRRIESCGGSLTYLHGGKPFIRGGDFSNRKHAMQLNYSRAFGGKDLKMYGLSAIPDISDMTINSKDRSLILGSDGVWDVMGADRSALVAERAFKAKGNPAEEIGKLALRTHEQKGSSDNVTSIVVFWDWD